MASVATGSVDEMSDANTNDCVNVKSVQRTRWCCASAQTSVPVTMIAMSVPKMA